MPPNLAPLVDAIEIVRLVGPVFFGRGQDYARRGAVSEIRWDTDAAILTGIVRGTSPSPYLCSILLGQDGRPRDSSCSCPMRSDCKHVAATILESNARAVRADRRAAPLPPQPAWKTVFETSAGTGATGRTVPMALLFELREPVPRSRSDWSGKAARTATAPFGTGSSYSLAVRPAVLGPSGKWVRTTVTWSTLPYRVSRLELRPDQHRWFVQFHALHRSTRETFGAQEGDWLYLDSFGSPLLWQLFDEARALGITMAGTGKGSTIAIGAEARLGIDASAQSIGDGFRLSTTLTIDGRPFPAGAARPIGDHGLYVFSEHPAFHLAPTLRPIDEEQRRLLSRASVTVPGSDVAEFLRDYYPRLRRAVELTSTDGTVPLPEIPPPTLVVTVTFAPKQRLGWSLGWDGTRDPDAEPMIRASVDELLPSSPRLAGIEAAQFADKVIPLLEALPGVRVDLVGDRPDYRELTEAPHLVITTVATDQPDWFDLGVLVTVEGRTVPFTPLFRALSKGESKLLLIDHSYLSLEHPAFDELRRLLAEASELTEWETRPRISRYQASLWSEFEDLADETEQAQAWRRTVGGLLAADPLPATPVPVGLLATLRPYQQDGLDWLAFLWEHRLGGILADDMGLGKTLQALALIGHAVAGRTSESPPSAPFLVVAPTSVVAGWLSEAERFAPGLISRAVTATESKSGLSIAETAFGADVVVTSYALFRLDFESYRALPWAGLILDEAQFVKNPASKAHQCALDLATPFKLAITGTPMENSLLDLWSLFQIVAPGLFPSRRRFADEYLRPIADAENPARLEKLKRRIRPLMMRRTKELVATELPAKQEQVLRVELTPRHRRLYETFLQKERQKLLGLIEDLDRNRFIVFRSLTLLRMLSLDASLVDEKYGDIPSAKLEALFERLDDVIAEGHRALVFSQFTSFLGRAAARLEAAGIAYQYLDGSTRGRASVISRFRDGNAPVFLISLKAGGFGLTLTEADYVFLLDPWWNPATETQAIDRTHRIGQTRAVNVYRMISSDTIEEKVMALKDRKARLFDAVMDDDTPFGAGITADDIRGLLED
ncbi:MAG TPA: DEAD/DEAH box helicase [Lacisediminihabitans sp.]|uniref:DEAD/DEAH box helicase n=1 Tax=Lacisediminihabitans sp. TaxID=2787631 RepID=UPI002ED8D4C3